MAWKILSRISGLLVWAIPAAMMLGFAAGLCTDPAPLKGLIVPFTFLMVYPMMVTLRVKKVFEGGDGRVQWVSQLINFGLIPFLAFGVGRLFLADHPYMVLGFLLAGLVPTSGMTISWTGFARGNLEAAVKMTVIGLTLGSLATPFYVKALMGARVEVDLAGVASQIALIVFLPMAAGYATQRALIRRYGQQAFQEVWVPRFPGLSTLGVLGIVFIALALKARDIAGAPDLLVKLLVPLVILYGANFCLSTLAGKAFFSRGDAVALVYGTVMRNLSIALAVAMNAFGPAGSEAALVIAMAYIVQVQSAAWYVKLTDRIFGPPAPPAKPSGVS
ncbi:MAG: arsenic resistance protein [Syntrophaceae bacterium]|nr:arsenic resistance protein [Syntrophaceae bacterium]